MSFLDYNQDIPGAQNDPSDDQSLMRTNTNSTRDWVQIDHFGFKNSSGGLHKQTRIINQLAIPAGLTSVMGTIYTKLAASTTGLTESNIFFTPGSSGNEYQISRVITASFALFGLNTNNYNAVGTRFTGGWTFLPGGLLSQYGSVTHTSQTLTTVIFPVQFTTGASIVVSITPISDDNDDHACSLSNASVSASQFNVRSTSSSHLTGFTWTAIGN